MSRKTTTKKPKGKSQNDILRLMTHSQAMRLIDGEVTYTGQPLHPLDERASEKDGSAYGGDFFHTKDMKHALDLMHNGWKERPELESLANFPIVGELVSQIELIRDVTGAFPDIQAFLNGEPDCMCEFTVQHAPRVIRVGFNITTSSSESEKTFHARGAVVLAVVNSLATMGYGVELHVINTIQKDGKFLDHVIEIKNSTQILNIDTLAFWASHPSGLRRMLFALQEREEENTRLHFGLHTGSGYGRTARYDATRTGFPMDILIDTGNCVRNMGEAKSFFEAIMEGFKEGLSQS